MNVKSSKSKHHMIIANYRQWKSTSVSCEYSSRNDEDAVKRFKDMTDIWSNVVKLGKHIFGDINIDRLESNDPENRPDLRNLIPILKEFQSDHNIILKNNKATRFRNNQRPTMLDLVMSNTPNNIENVTNITNFVVNMPGYFVQ